MKINLVNNGVFPIIKDKDGNLIEGIPDTGMQIAGTLQGEGKLTNTPCLFIRLSQCNIRCIFASDEGVVPCDTPYSSHNPEKNLVETQDVVDIVKHNIGNMRHIVISGGEPMLQNKQLKDLMWELRNQIREDLHITIETNGTVFSSEDMVDVDLLSISPKLLSSAPTKEKVERLKDDKIKYSEHWETVHNTKRINLKTIQSMIDMCYSPNGNYENRKDGERDFQLKFVVCEPSDIVEIQETFLKHLKGVLPEDVCLMPEGVDYQVMRDKSWWIIEECLKNGYRFCPRLHVMLFGHARSV